MREDLDLALCRDFFRTRSGTGARASRVGKGHHLADVKAAVDAGATSIADVQRVAGGTTNSVRQALFRLAKAGEIRTCVGRYAPMGHG
jgi:hypothetical protein